MRVSCVYRERELSLTLGELALERVVQRRAIRIDLDAGEAGGAASLEECAEMGVDGRFAADELHAPAAKTCGLTNDSAPVVGPHPIVKRCKWAGVCVAVHALQVAARGDLEPQEIERIDREIVTVHRTTSASGQRRVSE